jgi:hypothetical protein
MRFDGATFLLVGREQIVGLVRRLDGRLFVSGGVRPRRYRFGVILLGIRGFSFLDLPGLRVLRDIG